MINENFIRSINPKRLKLIVMPTEKCNFRCTYCYEDFNVGRMKPAVVYSLKKFLEKRSSEVNDLNIEWFGGEPLLAKNIIFDVMDNVAQHYPNFAVTSSMTTNGYLLTAPVFEKLVNLNVRGYQISLDGDEATHNQTRMLANGNRTFRAIWDNLLSFKFLDYQFSIKLRIHISSYNYDSVTHLLEKIQEEFGHDKRYKIFIKPLGRYGGKNDNSIPVLQGRLGKFITDGFQHLVKEIANGEIGTTQNLLNKGTICYAARANSYVIRADGRISKCTVALNDDINLVGHLLEDGTLELEQEKMRYWIRGFIDNNKRVQLCPARF